MEENVDIFEIRKLANELSDRIEKYIRSSNVIANDSIDTSDKVAAYSVTSNCYGILLGSIKSLLVNSDVDRIYILINEKKFPYDVPKEVIPIDVSSTNYIDITSPNYNTKYTIMCLLRLALCSILEKEDKILSLDYDTIIDRDISELWKLNMGDRYLIAGVQERDRTLAQIHGYFNGDDFTGMGSRRTREDRYINAAVMLMNLKQMRKEKLEEKALEMVNHEYYYFPEQDILNDLCEGRKYFFDDSYNVSRFTFSPEVQRIIHFAGEMEKNEQHPLIQKYKSIPWNVIAEHRRRKFNK